MIRTILHLLLALIALISPLTALADSQYKDALIIQHENGELVINVDNASPIRFDMEGDHMVFEYEGQKYQLGANFGYINMWDIYWKEKQITTDSPKQEFCLNIYDFKSVPTSELPDWIKFSSKNGHTLYLSENNTGSTREADVELGITGFNGHHKIHITQLPKPFISDDMQSDPTCFLFESNNNRYIWLQPQGDTFTFKYQDGFDPEISSIFIYDVNNEWFDNDEIGILSNIDTSTGTIKIAIPENKGLQREIYVNLQFKDRTYQLVFKQAQKGAPSFQEQIDALKELYTSTNGKKWKNNDNWLTDKYYSEWHGITCDGRYISKVDLPDNNICGEIPNSAIETLVQVCRGFEIGGNGLYGHLSDELQAMPQWQTRGMSILMQSPWVAEQRRFTNYKRNIKIPDYEIEYLFDGSYSSLYPLISKHRLNHIMVGNPSEYRCNQQLSYPDNFQTIVAHQDCMGDDRETTIRNNKDFKFKNVVRLWNCIYYELNLNLLGTTALIDNDGYLVDIFPKDWDIPESWEDEIIDGYLKEYLGEPKEHDWFTLEPGYTSTDYSQDGQWIQLQAATEGNGVNVVFIGDGFVDKDMDRYEEIMREGMEHLFSIEPLRSLRNRFNVYVVKVVSPNDYTNENGKHTLNRDYNIISEYVTKIPGVNFTTTHTCLIENKNDLFFVSGYTDMFADGGSVAVIDQGLSSHIIIHEVGGHGIGTLIDEYIFAGYEENHTQPGAEESFKQWIANDYHAQGWGMNISAESEPDKVPWARMLTDDYFGAETGIFMGAWMWPQELWRPSENSVMNTDYSRFNAPSREAIYMWVMKMSEGDSWQYDFDTFKAFDRVAMSKPQAMPQKAAASDGSTQKRRHRKAELPARIELRDGKYVRVPIPMP